MWSDYSQGCRGGGATKEKRDDTSPATGATDSLYQEVDVNNNKEISLAEYIAWVTTSRGQEVTNNATLLNLWIKKFET